MDGDARREGRRGSGQFEMEPREGRRGSGQFDVDAREGRRGSGQFDVDVEPQAVPGRGLLNQTWSHGGPPGSGHAGGAPRGSGVPPERGGDVPGDGPRMRERERRTSGGEMGSFSDRDMDRSASGHDRGGSGRDSDSDRGRGGGKGRHSDQSRHAQAHVRVAAGSDLEEAADTLDQYLPQASLLPAAHPGGYPGAHQGAYQGVYQGAHLPGPAIGGVPPRGRPSMPKSNSVAGSPSASSRGARDPHRLAAGTGSGTSTSAGIPEGYPHPHQHQPQQSAEGMEAPWGAGAVPKGGFPPGLEAGPSESDFGSVDGGSFSSSSTNTAWYPGGTPPPFRGPEPEGPGGVSGPPRPGGSGRASRRPAHQGSGERDFKNREQEGGVGEGGVGGVGSKAVERARRGMRALMVSPGEEAGTPEIGGREG